MKISIVMDGRFEWYADVPYSNHMAFRPFVERFLTAFDEVEICARAFAVAKPKGSPVIGPCATFTRLGNYSGATQFALQFPKIAWRLWQIAGAPHPVLAYLPGTLPIIFGFMRIIRGRPLYCLVVADPATQLGPNSVDHPLAKIARPIFVASLRYLLKYSNAAMYVTRHYLQSLYPLTKNGVAFATSDVYLTDESYIAESRDLNDFSKNSVTIVYVAMMSQSYKGHDDLIHAYAEARQKGRDLKLVLVGDGQLRSKLEALSEKLGVRDGIEFVGKMSHGAEMISVLDSADLFVMASRAEGLPRALVEAMARGLPAISTDVGGVGELLSDEFLVPVDRPAVLASKIAEVSSDQKLLTQMSETNLRIAREYHNAKTSFQMTEFYRFVRSDHLLSEQKSEF